MRLIQLPVLLLLAAHLVPTSHAQVSVPGNDSERPAPLLFPTENTSVLNGRPQYFYMGLTRLINGRNEFSWEGGMYGWVRNSRSTPAGPVFTRFHEGVDIAPVARDEDGEPLDVVLAMDEGRVVYVNDSPYRSDYGRYVVVEHHWEGSPFYTLHAHLAETSVRTGEYVDRGDTLGVLGYSGDGLDIDRAHVHFEINLMLSEHFVEWRNVRHPRWSGTHGRFHGYNLTGIPPMEILSRRHNPRNSIIDFLQSEPAEITVFVPGGPTPDMLEPYPWLCRTCENGQLPESANSWEVGFTRAGRPVYIEPAQPSLSAILLGRIDGLTRANYLASRILTRRGPGADLNERGRQILSLIFTQEGEVPEW